MAFSLASLTRLIPYSKCIICERRHESRMVNTGRNFISRAGPYTGRKYLCQDCVIKAAEVLGFPNMGYVETLEDNVQELKHLTLELEARLEHFTHLGALSSELEEWVREKMQPEESRETVAED